MSTPVRLTPAQLARLGAKGAEKRPQKQRRALPPQFVPEVGPNTLLLPYPISTNAIFTTWADGSRHKSEAALAYREEVGTIARQRFPEPIAGPVAVHIDYWPKSGVGLDIDNCAKATLDAMKGIAWNDDRQVWRLVIERRPCVPGGAFAVTIEDMETP